MVKPDRLRPNAQVLKKKKINDDTLASYRQSHLQPQSSLACCSLNDWHEDPRSDCSWDQDCRCHGDGSNCREVVRSDMFRTRPCCREDRVGFYVHAGIPFRACGIRCVRQWLWNGKSLWTDRRRLSCCCYCCWSARLAILRRIADRHAKSPRVSVQRVSFFLTVVLEAAAEDRSGYGDHGGRVAQMVGHML